MMKSGKCIFRWIVLFMVLLVTIEPLEVQAIHIAHTRLPYSPQFAEANKIPGSPFSDKWGLPTEKQLAISSLAAFPLFQLYFPGALFWLGTNTIMGPIVSLKNKTENLNKIAKELTLQKSIVLLPYLGTDGLELLTYFFQKEQYIETGGGKKKKIKLFKKNGQRKEGTSVLVIRDLLRKFIADFQERAKEVSKEKLVIAHGETYEKDIRYFLSRLGLVTFSEKTLFRAQEVLWPKRMLSDTEINLYKILSDENILDKDGGFFVGKSSHAVIRALLRIGIHDELLQKYVLHDLGLLFKTDVTQIESTFSLLKEQDGLKAPFFVKLKMRRLALAKSLEKILHFSPTCENQLKDQFDTTLLEGLLSEEDIRVYEKTHRIKIEGKSFPDRLTLLKLVFVRSAGQEDYNYLSLEEDLQLCRAFAIRSLCNEQIQSDLYRMVTLSGEDVVVPTLIYIKGVGFISLGLLEQTTMILNIILQQRVNALNAAVSQAQTAEAATTTSEIRKLTQQIEMLEQAISMLHTIGSSVLMGIGLLTIVVNTYQALGRLQELRSVKNSTHVGKLLIEHLKTTTRDPMLKGDVGNNHEIIQFNAVTDNCLRKVKKKSLINGLGLNGIWIVFGCLATFNGVSGLMLLFASSVAIVFSTFGGNALLLFFGAGGLPIVLLILRELRLQEEFVCATKAIGLFQEALAKKQPHLERKQHLFLQIFLRHVKEGMKLARIYVKIQDYQKKLSQANTADAAELYLVKLYKTRRKAIQQWEKLQQNEQTNKDIQGLIHEEVSLQKSSLTKELMHKYPSSFRSSVDFLVETFYPGLQKRPTLNFLSEHPLPENKEGYFYERERYFSNLFVHTYQIYNHVRSTLFAYNYLVHKKNLQIKYFNTPLTKSEENHMARLLNNNKIDAKFLLTHTPFPTYLEGLHNSSKVSENEADRSCVPWGEDFLFELRKLYGVFGVLKKKIRSLSNNEVEEDECMVPQHTCVELLMRYFLPLRLIND